MINGKISVIVPVYKAEKYIEKCLDSLLNQTYTNLEVIAIDDGTPDRSGIICDTYAEKDDRLIVVHTENRGVAAARNKGLEYASGDFIAFVDSDDYIDSTMYELLLSKLLANNADMAYCEATHVFPDGSTTPDSISQLQSDCLLTKENWTPQLLMEMAGAVTHALYTRTLVQKIGYFNTELTFSEDRIFNISAMGSSEYVYFVKQSPYHLNVNEASITHSYHSNHFEVAQKAYLATTMALKQVWDDNEQYQNLYLAQFIDAYNTGIRNLIEHDKEKGVRHCYLEIQKVCDNNLFRQVVERYTEDSDILFLMRERKYLFLYCYITSHFFARMYSHIRYAKRIGMRGIVKKLLVRRG